MNKSITLPPTVAACSAGTAFIEATPPNGQNASPAIALADGSKPFAGFITRDVLALANGVPAVPMPTYSELSEGMSPSLPLETQFSAGLEGSVEDAEEYEAEGISFISSGNGNKDITANTAVGTRCSFINGTSCVAQAGQYAEYYLAEQQTPQITGNVRCRFVRLFGIQS